MEVLTFGCGIIKIGVVDSKGIVGKRIFSIEKFNSMIELSDCEIILKSDSHEDLINIIKKSSIEGWSIFNQLNTAMNAQYSDDGMYLITENIKCSEVDTDSEDLTMIKITVENELKFEISNMNYLEAEDVTYMLKFCDNEEDCEEEEVV